MNYVSKEDDCFELYFLLRSYLKDKIDYYGTPYNALFSGKYYSSYDESHSDLDYLFKEGLPFNYKFNKEAFLRISVGKCLDRETTMGEKLAALSDFYEAIRVVYGEPTVFYTIKDDDEEAVTFEWLFKEKEAEIKKFKEGTRFDDGKTDTLIIFGEEVKTKGYTLNPETKKLISNQIGLPFEMLSILDENVEDFIKYKKGIKVKVRKKERK